MKLKNLSLLLFLISSHVCSDDGRGDLCDGDNPILFANVPADVQSELVAILIGAANALGGACLGIAPNYDKVKFLLIRNDTTNYTRIDIQNPVGIDNKLPLYILSHGWLSGFNGYKIKAFRDKYTALYGKNILFINWGELAWYPYTTAACNIPYIGMYVAKFLCGLSETENIDIRKIHMIGHSLGGQLSGFVGKYVQKLCDQKLGRITALDPAGPMFQVSREAGRLVATDAEFVEVVHTNAGLFGYLGKAGTVDYNVNCGSMQPGCWKAQDFNKIAEMSIYALICHHMRALELWPFALESKEFKAKSCMWCPFILPGICFTQIFRANYTSLGHTYTIPPSENYYLPTGPNPPYHLGCSAYCFPGCV